MTRAGTPCFRAIANTVSGIDVETTTRPCASPNSRARAGNRCQCVRSTVAP